MATIALRVDPTAAEQGFRRAERASDSFRRAASETVDRTRRIEGEFNRLGGAVTATTGAFAGLKGILGTIGFALLARSVLDATMKLQRINSTLVVATGSLKGAKEAMAFVNEEAERLGLNATESALEFGKLAAAAKGTALEGQAARDIFVAISEASTAMGLSAEETSGALNALQQMISKGRVSAEELRGQLGERLPGAFQLAAQAMGVTTQELTKMMERGEVTAEELLPKLARELHETFGGQAATAADGLRSNINRLGNAINNLLAQDDGMPAANEAIKTFTATIKDPSFQRGFDHFVAKVAELVNAGAGLLKIFDPIAQIRQEISALENARDRAPSESDASAMRRLFGLPTKESFQKEINERLRELGRLTAEQNAAAGFQDGGQTNAFSGGAGSSQGAVSAPPLETVTFTAKSQDLKNVNLIAGRQNELLDERSRLLQQIQTPQERYNEQIKLLNELRATTNTVTGQAFISEEQYARAVAQAQQQLQDASASTSALNSAASDLGFAFSSSFEEAIISAKSFSEVLKGLAEDIQRVLIRRFITDQLANALVGGITGSFGGGAASSGATSGGSLSGSLNTSITPQFSSLSANGNAFDASGIVPFAAGGIVNRPTMFKFANGTGLMGEAGPEAILPLRRNAQGKLGVASSGGGVVVNVINQGQPLQVQSQSQRRGPDGRQVIDVMVAESFRRQLGNGEFDSDFAQNLGVRRPGRF